MLKLGATLYERMLSFPTPVVVACTGHAVAAGAFLVLSADARVGVDGPFQVCMNEVRIGLTMPWFAIEVARQRLTPQGLRPRRDQRGPLHAAERPSRRGSSTRSSSRSELAAAAMSAGGALAELNMTAHAADEAAGPRGRPEGAAGRNRDGADTRGPEHLLGAARPLRPPTPLGCVDGRPRR